MYLFNILDKFLIKIKWIKKNKLEKQKKKRKINRMKKVLKRVKLLLINKFYKWIHLQLFNKKYQKNKNKNNLVNKDIRTSTTIERKKESQRRQKEDKDTSTSLR